MRVVLSAMILSALALPAMGSVGLERFDCAAWFTRAPGRIGQSGTLRVSMRGDYADSVRGEARIVIPSGIALVAGDTLHRARPTGPEAEWEIVIRALAVGRHEIRGYVRIEDLAHNIDEGEFVLPLEVRTDTVLVGGSQTIRMEFIHGNQRYRYGGEYLVPIDGPEYIVPGDIASKPRILERQSAVDSLGRSASAVRIPFVVFIDRQGRLRDARLRGGSRNAQLEKLASEALYRWTFAPAMTKSGQPVDDWLEVRVEVIPAR